MAIFLVLLVCFMGSVQSFDQVLYVAQWAPSYCSVSNDVKCKIPINTNSFSIHGIWPSNTNGVRVPACPGERFMIEKVKSIANDLDLYWPNLRETDSNIGFWRHEWDQHGTCTGWTIEKYFGFGVARAKELNVLAALKKNGIVVGGEYDLALIKSSFPGANVQATCNRHKTTGKVQLQELMFCLNRAGGFVSCSVKNNPSLSCISSTINGTNVEKVVLPNASVV
ncbi:Ribonuclease DdI [Euphorbia peplus]|nr:Ribonuclease DdI [Euphorbia peplus]